MPLTVLYCWEGTERGTVISLQWHRVCSTGKNRNSRNALFSIKFPPFILWQVSKLFWSTSHWPWRGSVERKIWGSKSFSLIFPRERLRTGISEYSPIKQGWPDHLTSQPAPESNTHIITSGKKQCWLAFSLPILNKSFGLLKPLAIFLWWRPYWGSWKKISDFLFHTNSDQILKCFWVSLSAPMKLLGRHMPFILSLCL